jgi:hypothetical protein
MPLTECARLSWLLPAVLCTLSLVGAGILGFILSIIARRQEVRSMHKMRRDAPPKPHESIEREIASLRARVARLEREDRG